MRLKTLAAIISCVLCIHAQAQYILETPDGNKVELFKNGTWKYLKSEPSKKTNSYIPQGSTSIYTSFNKKFNVYFDSKEWTCDSIKKGDAINWDASFTSKDYAIQAYCLDSRLSMPLASVENTLRQQWQPIGEIKSLIVYADTLNETPFSKYEMVLYVSGIEYVYHGYIYSAARGSFHFFVGTQKEIFIEDKAKIEKLFKGLSKL